MKKKLFLLAITTLLMSLLILQAKAGTNGQQVAVSVDPTFSEVQAERMVNVALSNGLNYKGVMPVATRAALEILQNLGSESDRAIASTMINFLDSIPNMVISLTSRRIVKFVLCGENQDNINTCVNIDYGECIARGAALPGINCPIGLITHQFWWKGRVQGYVMIMNPFGDIVLLGIDVNIPLSQRSDVYLLRF
jgi:hypothetical protein